MSQRGAFARFWWLAFLGLCGAVVAGAAVIYHFELSMPPELTERTPPSYTATTRILLNNAENPIVRTGVTEVTPRPPQGEGAGGQARPPIVETSPPGLDPLIAAANLLPLVIESDAVAALRRDNVGRQRGEVSAQQLFARETPGGGVRPSDVPVIEVRAVSPTPREAVRLVKGSVAGLQQWMLAEQKKAKIPPRQRIVAQPLNKSPAVTSEDENPHGLALVVVGAVLAGVAMLITLLHRLFPPRKPAPDVVAENEAARAAREASSERLDDLEPSPERLSDDGSQSPRGRLQAWLEEPASGPPPGGEAKLRRSGRR